MDAGGCHTFCDTDSMAIVASEHGGLVPCPGGPHRLSDGTEAVYALSWMDVDRIANELASLNPYDCETVPGSILKIEDVNFDRESNERRQVWCVSIAAKRYALFTLSERGEPTILHGTTRHGLGFLIDPRGQSTTDANDSAKLAPWKHDLWAGIVRERLGLPHDLPRWHDRPAAMRHTVSSPWHLRAFRTVNNGKPYAKRIKPFSFMLAVPLASQGRPHGIAPDAPLKLVTSYESNLRRWTLRSWFDLYSGQRYHITTTFPGGGMGTAGVKSLGSVAGAYPFHPEPKRCGPDGAPCGRRTTGLLSRRPVRPAGTVCIGKEAHRLEERDLVAGLDELQSVYLDPRRELWSNVVLPRLRALAGTPDGRIVIANTSRLKPRAIRDMLADRSRPRKPVRVALMQVAMEHHRTPERRCSRCGELLITSDPRKRYCSSQCRKNAREQRNQQNPEARITSAKRGTHRQHALPLERN